MLSHREACFIQEMTTEPFVNCSLNKEVQWKLRTSAQFRHQYLKLTRLFAQTSVSCVLHFDSNVILGPFVSQSGAERGFLELRVSFVCVLFVASSVVSVAV